MIRQLTPLEAQRELTRLHVIDVRAEHEYRGPLGRLKGAQLVPLPELEDRIDEVPRPGPLLLVCRSGKRSQIACQRLTELGIGPVANLEGGMIAWNRAGLGVEQDEPANLAELLESVVAWTAQVSPLSRDEAQELCRTHLEGLGASFDAPTTRSLDQLLELIEASLQTEPPPDLELSVNAFRRQLAVL